MQSNEPADLAALIKIPAKSSRTLMLTTHQPNLPASLTSKTKHFETKLAQTHTKPLSCPPIFPPHPLFIRRAACVLESSWPSANIESFCLWHSQIKRMNIIHIVFNTFLLRLRSKSQTDEFLMSGMYYNFWFGGVWMRPEVFVVVKAGAATFLSQSER